MDIQISILDLKKEEFVRSIYDLEENGIRAFHIDVMDGEFAGKNNIDYMYTMLNTLDQISIMKKEVHLMTYNLERNIELFSFLEPSAIIFHIEAVKSKEDTKKIIRKILSYNILPGISINPYTDIEEIYEFLPYISKVLVMTVEPGKGGQTLIQDTIDKVIKLKKYIAENNLDTMVMVDGGVNDKTSRILRNVGVDEAVVGSYITKSNSIMYREKLKKISEGTNMLVNTKDMLLKAAKEKYAVGAFNFTNMENLQAIMEAANETNSPVILQTSSAAIKYMGMDYIVSMVEAAGKNSKIPFALHLDHGASFEIAKECIDAGYTSVMIDVSSKPFEENVEITKKVVEYAHARGVTVEAELGRLAGIEDDVNVSEDDAMYTNPEEAEEFVKLTGVDSLAIAIGTSHGAYKFKGEPRLRFDILEKVIERLPNTPIVLHGASTVIQELVETCNRYGAEIPGAKGCPDDMLHEASLRGISKINVDTDLRLAMTSEVRKMFVENPSTFNPRDYLGAGKEMMKETVKHKIKDVFGSENKADKE